MQITPGKILPDPTMASGYAPFGINNIGGKLYVTYAKQDATSTTTWRARATDSSTSSTPTETAPSGSCRMIL